MKRSISLRWRLTAWYVGVLAGVLVLFSLVVYFAFRQQQLAAQDMALRDAGLLLEQTIALNRTSVSDVIRTAQPGERFVRLYDTGGRIVDASSWLPDHAPTGTQGFVQAVARTGRWQVQTLEIGDARFRVLSMPIRNQQQIVGVVQIAQTLRVDENAQHQLLMILVLCVPAMLLLASWGGAFLAGRALAPIDRVTQAAQQISAHDLSQRLGPPPRNDELGRLSMTFDAMIARLDMAFQQQRQFTADASHELRTPLTAMRGQIEVALRHQRSAAEYQEVLQRVLHQTERLSRLVSSLLLLARADAKALMLEQEKLDIAEIVQDVVTQLQPIADAQGVQFQVGTPPGCVVRGDRDRLLQLLFNLVDNALTYTAQGGIVALQCHADKEALQIEICDTGPGIASEHVPHIFERFYRIDAARNHTHGGAGLGLAIVKTLVEAHGGSITVQSTPGRGSVFTLRFPYGAKQ